MELYYLLFIIAPLVYQLLNFKAVFAYSDRNEVICIDGFETNKKPGNQFQNKSLKAILFSSSIRRGSDQISSSLFNTSSLQSEFTVKEIIYQKISFMLIPLIYFFVDDQA